MKKESVAAAERELQWATEKWHAIQALWAKEYTATWDDFSQTNRASVSIPADKAGAAFASFASSQSAHTVKNLREARREWAAFLLHANRVFAKLQQGSKAGGSQPWYGTVINERREDPLLQYIHQARDAENHGDTTLGLDIVIDRAAPKVSMIITPQALTTGSGISGAIMDLPRLILLPATTRSGTYMPPARHLGRTIRPEADVVAEATLTYLAQIVARAKACMI